MSKYDEIISRVFGDNFTPGSRVIPINREELAEACDELSIPRIKNLGDIPYSYRFRKELPQHPLKNNRPRVVNGYSG